LEEAEKKKQAEIEKKDAESVKKAAEKKELKSKKLEKIAKLKEKIKVQLNAIEEIEIRITKEQEQVDTLKEALEKVL